MSETRKVNLNNVVALQLTDREIAIVNRYVDGGRRPDTPTAAYAIFMTVLGMIDKDYMRLRFLNNGTVDVDIKGVDYD